MSRSRRGRCRWRPQTLQTPRMSCLFLEPLGLLLLTLFCSNFAGYSKLTYKPGERGWGAGFRRIWRAGEDRMCGAMVLIVFLQLNTSSACLGTVRGPSMRRPLHMTLPTTGRPEFPCWNTFIRRVSPDQGRYLKVSPFKQSYVRALP